MVSLDPPSCGAKSVATGRLGGDTTAAYENQTGFWQGVGPYRPGSRGRFDFSFHPQEILIGYVPPALLTSRGLIL